MKDEAWPVQHDSPFTPDGVHEITDPGPDPGEQMIIDELDELTHEEMFADIAWKLTISHKGRPGSA